MTDLRRVFRRDRDPSWAWVPGPLRSLLSSRDLISFLLFGLGVAGFLYRMMLFDSLEAGVEPSPWLGIAGRALWLGSISVSLLAIGGLGALQRRVGRRLVVRAAAGQARPVNQWRALESLPDGTLVSLVGYVRAKAVFPDSIGGRQPVGVTLDLWVTSDQSEPDPLSWIPGRSRQRRGLAAASFNFDLVSEQGLSVPVAVRDGHLLLEPDLQATNIVETERLLGRLEAPAGARIRGGRYGALFDRAAIEVIGFVRKQPGRARGEPSAIHSVEIASRRDRPLLVIPLRT